MTYEPKTVAGQEMKARAEARAARQAEADELEQRGRHDASIGDMHRRHDAMQAAGREAAEGFVDGVRVMSPEEYLARTPERQAARAAQFKSREELTPDERDRYDQIRAAKWAAKDAADAAAGFDPNADPDDEGTPVVVHPDGRTQSLTDWVQERRVDDPPGLADAYRTLDKAMLVLEHVELYFERKDQMNAAQHLSEKVLTSPLHSEVSSVLAAIALFNQSNRPATP